MQNVNIHKIHKIKDPNFERRVNEVTTGLQPYIRKHLLERVSRTNASIIIDYMQAIKSEQTY